MFFLIVSLFFVWSSGEEINRSIPTNVYHNEQYNELNFIEKYASQIFNENFTIGSSFTLPNVKLNLSQILSVVPTIEESLPIHSSNEHCARHSRFVLQSANQLEIWALKLIDSSGKIPPSLLRGNINQLGDFDQCVSVHGVMENDKNPYEAAEDIYGKYCLASIDVTLPLSMKTINNLIHSHYVIRSRLTDPGHRIPKFASMNWALCVPHTCSNEDVKSLIVKHLQKLEIPGLKKDVSMEEFMCQTKSRTSRVTLATALTILLFLVVILVSVIGTFYDERTLSEKSTQCAGTLFKWWYAALESFSLKKNYRSLTSTAAPIDDVSCLHGIRAMNAIALLLSHKCMQLLYYSYVNRTQMSEVISYPYSMMARSAIVYTDSFILISGCLAAQCFLKNFERKSGGVFRNYINRFLRLTPNLVAIILFCTFVLPLLNSGPLWNAVISRHAELCQKYWWRNILYVHNYFGFEEMCLTHTHQLGIDMQLYITSPLLIYLLWRFPLLGGSLSVMLATISTYLRYQVTFQHNLSPIIYYGVSVSQLFNTATLSYILPTHRATVYIMGILLGYYLHYNSTVPLKLSKAQVNVGTFFFTTCGFLSMFGTYWMSNSNYKYSAREAALYMAFSPLVWCSALIWGILINVHGYTGFIGELFKWPGFRIFTRIAYAIYLIQFPVYFYNVGTAKTPTYFTTQVLLNVEEFTVIFVLSVVLTLLFDLPFQSISKRIKFNRIKTNMATNSINKIAEKVQ